MARSSGRSEPPSPLTLEVPAAAAASRLDQFLALNLPQYSRARLQRWLKAGLVQVNGVPRPPSHRVRQGDRLLLTVPPPEPSPLAAQALPLDIVYEDRDLIVVNKPPGVVVHPGAGHRQGTLLNALLHHCPDLKEIGDQSRPGLVHRLDKDTSGLLVAAKTALAHAALVRQFQERRVEKRYLALVWGRLPAPVGEITGEIGRHPTQRRKMSARPRRGKEAVTGWRVLRELPGPLTLVELTPKTGRTHQLRVHLASLGRPVAGDVAYGGGAARLKGSPALRGLPLPRQMLHAASLSFTHPRSGEPVGWEAPLPEDFWSVLKFIEGFA
ncbi:MAG: RluA family pseudouridine synthase [Deltaproteobacteria bacterium]|nr:RluA family pseudouridine synthase [Deltaproteobacteria bacterium]